MRSKVKLAPNIRQMHHLSAFALYRLSTLAPELFYLLQRLTLGLGNQLPYENCTKDPHNSINPVGESMIEFCRQPLIIVHHGEGQRYHPVRDPLGRNGDGQRSPDTVGKY